MGIRVFDLFCGAGGSSCGARMAGATPVGGIDLWTTATTTYELNFCSARTYRAPIRRLSARSVARDVGPIHLLLASPECTNHSVAKGNAPRCEDSRRTAFDVIRFAKVMQPRWIVVENVISMQRWDAYLDWLSKLQQLGYKTRELKLNAADFGVPQSRRRLFVVGDLERMPKPLNTSNGPKADVRTILQSGTDTSYSYRRRALFGAGRAPATLVRAQRAIDALGSDQPFLLVYYGTDAAGGWQTLDRPLRTITTLDRFALVEPNGGQHEMRMLQPPELAAAMGFPADYLWPRTTRRERIKLVGNAVSPPVMKAVIESLIS